MNDDQKEILKTLMPYLLATALLTATLVLGVLKLTHSSYAGPGNMVTFDVVKFTNAERAVASQFIKGDGADSSLLLSLSKKTRESIAKIAGRNATVVLKQAVVQGNLPDITDKVLKDLGLPTNVPTQDPSAYALDEAPTMLILNKDGGNQKALGVSVKPKDWSAPADGSNGVLP